MSAKKQLEKEIRDACVFLREKNQTTPSDTIQFMLDASLEKLERLVSSRRSMLLEENLKDSLKGIMGHMGVSDKEKYLLKHIGIIPSLQGLDDKERLKTSKFMYVELCGQSKTNIFPKIEFNVHGVPPHMFGAQYKVEKVDGNNITKSSLMSASMIPTQIRKGLEWVGPRKVDVPTDNSSEIIDAFNSSIKIGPRKVNTVVEMCCDECGDTNAIYATNEGNYCLTCKPS